MCSPPFQAQISVTQEHVILSLYKQSRLWLARMLLTALYHMLKNGENYNAELYRKSDLPPVDREITVEQAIIIARNQGYKIKSATA